MAVVLNNTEGSPSFTSALNALLENADTVSVAVSYIQVGGWEMFRGAAAKVDMARIRMVCTDQLGITHPQAVRRALDSGVQIRNFVGNNTFHPKIFLAYAGSGSPSRCLLGSANLSVSAFTTSSEAGVLFDEPRDLDVVSAWYETLFVQQSEEFTPESLLLMEARWKAAAAARVRLGLGRQKIKQQSKEPLKLDPPQVAEALEDILAAIQLPIGLLNMDYGGNNARNINKIRELLQVPSLLDSKQKSELKLLGFMVNGMRTKLGERAAKAKSDEAFARIWCSWLREATDAELSSFNIRLIKAKRVFSKFWTLKADVREFFLANARSPKGNRRTLQTVELMCNANALVTDLPLESVVALSELLSSDKVPSYIRAEIDDYFDNKGTRSWDVPDRRTVPTAWAEVMNAPI